MDRIEIWGKVPLSGEVAIQGSKNAALPLMAAAVLHPGKTVLRNCPHILDVEYMSRLLRELGCTVFWEGNALVIEAGRISGSTVSPRFATSLRASVLLLGSLLGRMRSACLPYPGGCTIGQRPIDLHLHTFAQMGADVKKQADGILIQAEDELQGCEIAFPFPSVGATENSILGAVRARGVTVLKGCAAEPEIEELCRFLNLRGAKISGVGSQTLTITGTDASRDLEYELMPDRIVAGTYLLAVAGTRGCARLLGAQIERLGALADVLAACGAKLKADEKGIFLDAADAGLPVKAVATAPYPGFPTDLQSQMMAFFCTLPGDGKIEENLFESRFQTAGELRKMGARIHIEGTCAYIYGPSKLHGAGVNAKELRGGAALVSAGLSADGRTVVSGNRFIRRGYEDICRDFTLLGADIREI